MVCETLPHGSCVYTDENNKISFDGLLLALFSKIKRFDRILDVGTGCGIIPLKLYDEGLLGECVALEIDPTASYLADSAAKKNMFARMSVINCDAREYASDKKFDAVFCNPPYFNNGTPSENEARSAARHEISLTLRDAAVIARRSLKEGGKLFICYRAERLDNIFSCFEENELRIKRLRFVRSSPDASPWLVLVEARYRSGPGVNVMPDLIVKNEIKE
ncbi:MAG: methyltransferase [Ruminococcaceae bacterium]|nr:methyltransferase [Oscillospiraceae bacterium]